MADDMPAANTILDFIDPGAGDDEPCKAGTQGDLRQWHDALVESDLEVQDLLKVFADHYWDSLEKDKGIVLAHIRAVLDKYVSENRMILVPGG
jgi:hypothetical protein